jgi:hypothetical protein
MRKVSLRSHLSQIFGLRFLVAHSSVLRQTTKSILIKDLESTLRGC